MTWINALHDQIFHSFWTWTGTVILISIGAAAFGDSIRGFLGRQR